MPVFGNHCCNCLVRCGGEPLRSGARSKRRRACFFLVVVDLFFSFLDGREGRLFELGSVIVIPQTLGFVLVALQRKCRGSSV